MVITVIGDSILKKVLADVLAQKGFHQLICNQKYLIKKQILDTGINKVFKKNKKYICNCDKQYPSDVLNESNNWFYGDTVTLIDHQVWSTFFSLQSKPVNKGYYPLNSNPEVKKIYSLIIDLMKMTDIVVYGTYSNLSTDIREIDPVSLSVLIEIYDHYIRFISEEHNVPSVAIDLDDEFYSGQFDLTEEYRTNLYNVLKEKSKI